MKFFLTGFLLAFSISGAIAQKISASKVPPPVLESFQRIFPAAKQVNWEMEKKDIYEAGFNEGGKSMSANFSAKGEWLETETVIRPSELPKAVTDYISMHQKGAVIKEAAVIRLANGQTHYEAEVNGKDLVFDEKGNPIRK